MPHVDKTCTTHHACDCISAELDRLKAENERLKADNLRLTIVQQRLVFESEKDARIAELEVALRPFATQRGLGILPAKQLVYGSLRVGDFIRATAALEGK